MRDNAVVNVLPMFLMFWQSLLLTFLCLDFQLVQVIVLEIIYICAEGLLVFVLVPACGVATLILDFPYLSWHTSRPKKISFFRCRRT